MDDRNSLKRARLGVGVSFDKKRGGKNYKTRIHFRSREVLLGRYKTCHEARMAYDQAAAMLAKYKDGVSTNYPPGSYRFYDPQVERKVLALLAATATDGQASAGTQQLEVAGTTLFSADWQQQLVPQVIQQQPDCQQLGYTSAAVINTSVLDAAVDHGLTSFSSDNSSSSAELLRQDSQSSQKQQTAFQQPEQQQDLLLQLQQLQHEPWPQKRRRQSRKARVPDTHWPGVQLPLVICDAPLQHLLQAIVDLPTRSAAAVLFAECAA